jgi:hypothetical protein
MHTWNKSKKILAAITSKKVSDGYDKFQPGNSPFRKVRHFGYSRVSYDVTWGQARICVKGIKDDFQLLIST